MSTSRQDRPIFDERLRSQANPEALEAERATARAKLDDIKHQALAAAKHLAIATVAVITAAASTLPGCAQNNSLPQDTASLDQARSAFFQQYRGLQNQEANLQRIARDLGFADAGRMNTVCSALLDAQTEQWTETQCNSKEDWRAAFDDLAVKYAENYQNIESSFKATAKAAQDAGWDVSLTLGSDGTGIIPTGDKSAEFTLLSKQAPQQILDHEQKVAHEQVQQLFDAASRGDVEQIKQLVADGASLYATDAQGNHIGHHASRSLQKGVLDFISEAAPLLMKNTNAAGELPRDLLAKAQAHQLFEAASQGNLEKIQELRDDGANMNATDAYGNMALHLASAALQKETADYLATNFPEQKKWANADGLRPHELVGENVRDAQQLHAEMQQNMEARLQGLER